MECSGASCFNVLLENVGEKEFMANWSERQFVEAIENNRFDAFASLGRSSHGEVHEETDMLRIFTNISVLSPLCGWIFRVQFPVIDLDRKIDQALSDFASKKIPVIWNTGPSTQPPDLETHLLRHGLTPLFELAGMGIYLDALTGDLNTPTDLEIKPVAEPETLEQWADIFTKSFNVYGNMEESIYQLFANLVFDPDVPWYHFLGVRDGAPVATSAMYISAGVAGIYFVGTIPEARKRGIGSAVTWAPLRMAKEIGYTIAVLHASPMAVNMYRSLGFQEYCQMGLFAWQPGEEQAER
jgi:ribosomal protein S18 acetylase RimI-like enzyme